MRIQKFFQFFESMQDASTSPVYQAFQEEIRLIEEFFAEIGLEVKSSNCYYRPNSTGVGGRQTGECPYAFVKLADGSRVEVYLMYGKMDYNYYWQGDGFPAEKTHDLAEFLGNIRERYAIGK